MKLIFTVINTSWAVLKIRPEKIFMPVQHGIWMHDLCDSSFFFSFRPYFHYFSGSVHYSKDHFNSCLYPKFTYMIFTVIYSSLNRFIWNQHNDQLPVGLLAQLVISHTGLNFFRPCFHYCSGSVHCCKDHLHIQVFIHSSHIWFSYIHSQEIWC